LNVSLDKKIIWQQPLPEIFFVSIANNGLLYMGVINALAS
jgi:hypothetical protein